MTTQENTYLLSEILIRLDELVKLMKGKRSLEPEIQFTKANENASMVEMQKYEIDLYTRLDDNK